LLFGDDVQLEGDVHWFVWESGKDYPVGFCSAGISMLTDEDGNRCYAFLSRAGVLPEARGHKLQRRMIKVREKWAKDQGLKGASTYVANWNTRSLINLLKSGYQIYEPHSYKRGKWSPIKRDGFTYLIRYF